MPPHDPPITERCLSAMTDIVSHSMLGARLEGRSLARGLPAPVPDRGGLRVDTNAEGEVCRWVFPNVSDDLIALADQIKSPGYLLKACAPPERMRAVLSQVWTLAPAGYFMTALGNGERRATPEGYTIEVKQDGVVTFALAISSQGVVAAGGYAAETDGAFVYDRIVTSPQHRRRGLASAIMTALGTPCENRPPPSFW
jgi:hypothetical protein